jgi:hypothetical protein
VHEALEKLTFIVNSSDRRCDLVVVNAFSGTVYIKVALLLFKIELDAII